MNKNPMSVGCVVNFFLNESDEKERKQEKNFECENRRKYFW